MLSYRHYVIWSYDMVTRASFCTLVILSCCAIEMLLCYVMINNLYDCSIFRRHGRMIVM
jgi:hypothetical protein